MSTEQHFRAYINPQAAMSEAEQKTLVEKFAPAEIYIERRHKKAPKEAPMRQAWLDSLRKGESALVPDFFTAARLVRGKDKRYSDLLTVKDQIHDLGAIIVEAATGNKSNDRKQWAAMRDRAYAMLDGASRLGKKGKASLGFTNRELEIMQAIMESRNYRNWPERRAAMEARGIQAPGRTWCLEKLPKRAKNVDKLIEITPAFKRAPSRAKATLPSQVYFIKCGEAVKIGRSIKPFERVAALAGANHQKLELLATMLGGPIEEKALHKRFAEYHIKREWFRYSIELAKFIKEKAKLNRSSRGPRFIRKTKPA